MLNLRKKVTPQKMASEIWGALVQIMQHEFDEANKHDKSTFKARYGWDYNKKLFTEESAFLFTFLIFAEVENHFAGNKDEIFYEFKELLITHDMEFLLDPLNDYYNAWNDAHTRRNKIKDGSALNDPFYCISKLAAIRCFGEKDGLDIRKIIMFHSRVKGFIKILRDNFKRYKII